MKNIAKKAGVDLEACKKCTVGSCCYEGAELTKKEVQRITKFAPKVAKPWFRLVAPSEDPDGVHDFTTIVRNGSCVFHDKNNRCMVYPVRPGHCRDFPLESGKKATYYEYLCVLFRDQWAPNSKMRRIYAQREKE